MMIVIEGSDGSGKTTTINYLRMLLEWPVIKGSDFEQATKGNEYLYQKFSQMSYLDRVIFDRFIYSNLVYASLYKDYAILNQDQANIIERRIEGRAKVFYLYCDLDEVKRRVSERGDDCVKVDMLEKIRNKYDEILDKSSLDIVHIDTTNKEPLEVAQKILRECGYAADS